MTTTAEDIKFLRARRSRKTLKPLTADDFAIPAGVHKALSDPTRVFILYMLGAQGAMSGVEILERVELAQPTVSHHLRVLVSSGLVKRSRGGRSSYNWSIDADHVGRTADTLTKIAQGVR